MNADGSFSSNESVGDPDTFAAFLREELGEVDSHAPEDSEIQGKKEEVPENPAPETNETAEIQGEQEEVIKVTALETNVEAGSRDIESWEIHDNEYYKSLGIKEIGWLEKNYPDLQTMEKKTVNCTSCNKQMHVKLAHVVRHPLLGVPICKNCKHFYENGIGWEQEEDGSDIYCRWCGHGGEVMICDSCLKGFCTKCLQRNLGRSKMTQIKEMIKWDCVACKPEDIYQQKCMYYGVYKYNLMKLIEPNKVAKPDIHSPKKSNSISGFGDRKQTFIDKTIAESFEAIKKYQKELEGHHANWLKGNRSLDNESATTFTNSLRKMHINLKRKVNKIDKSIVKSYIAVFPENATEIYNKSERYCQKRPRKNAETKIKIKHKEKTANALEKSKNVPKSIKDKGIKPSRIESKQKNVKHNTARVQKKRKACSKTQIPFFSILKYQPKVSTRLFQKKKKSKIPSGSDSEIDVEN